MEASNDEVYIYIHMQISVYIYVYIYIYLCVCSIHAYIYIYVCTEREVRVSYDCYTKRSDPHISNHDTVWHLKFNWLLLRPGKSCGIPGTTAAKLAEPTVNNNDPEHMVQHP